MSKGLPNRDTEFSAWYNQVVKRADLADHGPVKGTMVIKPYGFQLWDNIKEAFDKMIKTTGHVNAYFPLFIPKSFLLNAAQKKAFNIMQKSLSENLSPVVLEGVTGRVWARGRPRPGLPKELTHHRVKMLVGGCRNQQASCLHKRKAPFAP